MKCKACGTPVPDDSTFCPACGNNVAVGDGGFFANAGDLGDEAPSVSVWDTYQEEAPAGAQPPVPPVPPAGNHCPRCGAVMAPGESFCANCGLNLREAPAAPPKRAPAPGLGAQAAAVRGKMSKSSMGMLIGIGAGVLALILVFVIIGSATGWFGLVGPGSKMLLAAEKTMKKGNFTFEFEYSDDYDDIEGSGMVDIDMKKREVQLYMEMESDGDEMIVAIYDGYLLVEYPDYDYCYAEKISKELDDLFDAYEAARSGDKDEISDMLEDMGVDEDDLEDHVNMDELEKCITKLVKKLNSKSWLKENAGYSTRKESGATIHSVEPDMADLMVAILEVLEPAFQDEDDYEDIVDAAEDIDDVDILVEVGIKSGYLVSVDMEYEDDWDAMEFHATIKDIGKTKMDMEMLEDFLHDCK